MARRWLALFPLRGLNGEPFPASDARIAQLAADPVWVARTRGWLADLGWFMKCLKGSLASQENKEDGCTGAFWEGRFRSMEILDETLDSDAQP